MASVATAATKEISISLPSDMVQEIDDLAAKQGRTRDEVIQQAATYYLSTRAWRAIQAVVAPAFEAAGIRTEDDVEDLLDSPPDNPA